MKTANLIELLITIRTYKRLFTSVNSTMNIQIFPTFEHLVTIRTGERLFICMNYTMPNQTATVFELLATIRTCEGLFVSVKSKIIVCLIRYFV